MPFEFVHERRVEFADTDMAGIVHFANFFRYMEAAEHAFFRSLGLPLHAESEGRMSGWARVDARCDYRAPLFYGDLVAIELLVREKGRSSLVFDFHFHLREREGVAARPARPLASGSFKTVHVTRGLGEERMRASVIPEAVEARIEVAPAARLATARTPEN